jgi:hypothetical protein
VKEIISKEVLAFQHAEFGIEEPCSGGETASRQRARRQIPPKITIPRDRSSSRMASTPLPYLGSETPDPRERVPKTRCVPLPFVAGQSRPIGPAIRSKKQKSQCRIELGPNSRPTRPIRCVVESHHSVRRPFCANGLGPVRSHDVENVFQFSVVPVAVPK